MRENIFKKSKKVEIHQEKLRNVNASVEKKPKKQATIVMSQPESVMKSIDHVAEAGRIAEEAAEQKAKEKAVDATGNNLTKIIIEYVYAYEIIDFKAKNFFSIFPHIHLYSDNTSGNNGHEKS